MQREANPNKRPSKPLIEACRAVARVVSRVFWRVEFHNIENIPAAGFGGFIIAGNHQTYFDPVWISIPIKHDIRYLAWDKAFEWPILGSFIRKTGAIPVDLGPGGSVSTLRIALRLLRNGSAIVIFPEGSREFADGEFLPFQTGAVQLAVKSGVPILPVTIKGANEVWPREFRFPRFKKVDIYFHPLFDARSDSVEGAESEWATGKTEQLKKIIRGPLL